MRSVIFHLMHGLEHLAIAFQKLADRLRAYLDSHPKGGTYE